MREGDKAGICSYREKNDKYREEADFTAPLPDLQATVDTRRGLRGQV